MTVTAYSVTGMTCGHRASSRLRGGRRDRGGQRRQGRLRSGRVTVTSESSVDEAAVKAAVEEAGYTLVGPA